MNKHTPCYAFTKQYSFFLLQAIFFFLGITNAFSQNIQTIVQQGHSEYVSAIAISNNNELVASGSKDNAILLWHRFTGKTIQSFGLNIGKIIHLEFSNNDSLLLAGSTEKTIVVYNISTGKPYLSIVPDLETIQDVCYTENNKYILVSDNRKTILVYDAHSGDLVNTFQKNYGAPISRYVVDPTENCILSYGDNKTFHVIHVFLNDTLKSFQFDRPYTMEFSPDGKLIAAGSENMFAEVFFYSTEQVKGHYKRDEEIKCHGCKTQVKFSYDSKFLATAANKNGVEIWDLKNNKLKGWFMEKDQSYEHIAFSFDNKLLLAVQRKDQLFYNIQKNKMEFSQNNDGLFCKPQFTKDQNYICGDKDNTISERSLVTNNVIRNFKGPQNNATYNGIDIHQSNYFLSGKLNTINLKSATDISSDGIYLAKGKIDSIAVIINMETGKKMYELQGHSKPIIAVKFSPDNSLLATCGADGKIIIWDSQSGKLKKILKKYGDLVFDISFSHDGNYLVSGSWDNSIRIWDIKTGKQIKYISLEKTSPTTVGFTPSDIYLLSADITRGFTMWEADVAKKFRTFIGHPETVNAFCFSPNGKHITSTDRVGNVKEWDLLTGMQIHKHTLHSGSVNACVYLNDSIIITAGSDKQIIFWNKKDKRLYKKLLGHTSAITGMHITKNKEKLFTVDKSGEIKIWNLKTFKEIYSYFIIDRENWLAKTPEGYFDGTPKAFKSIHYVSAFKVLPIDAFFDKYFTPGLLKRISKGETFGLEGADLKLQIKNAPHVEIEIADNEKINSEENNSIVWYNNTIDITVRAFDDNLGIDEIRLYNNGKLISSSLVNESNNRNSKEIENSSTISLISGKNTLSAIAINKNRTESLPSFITIDYDGAEPESNLYLLAIGINKYENPSYTLSYALNDAKAYSKQMKTGSKMLFKNIEEIFIKDKQADKATIFKAFDSIAAKAKPNDIFIFYYAGHGTMNMQGKQDFYLIPFDVTQMYGNDKLLKEKAISANDMLEFSKKIEAQKQMFIIDACQAGATLETIAHRGADREKAIAKLARSTGTYFILASGAVQFASEAKELEHGLFTYAILEALQGKADGGVLDKTITAFELKSYVENRVPELTKKYLLPPQFPTGYSFGQDFPLVLSE